TPPHAARMAGLAAPRHPAEHPVRRVQLAQVVRTGAGGSVPRAHPRRTAGAVLDPRPRRRGAAARGGPPAPPRPELEPALAERAPLGRLARTRTGGPARHRGTRSPAVNTAAFAANG